MFGIARADVTRSRRHQHWTQTWLAFALASTAGGVASGLLLGAAGLILPTSTRAAIASLAAVAAIVLGLREASGRGVRPLQCDRETPRRWVEDNSMSWAVKNGMALGCGMTTRIGFWLWYVVPVSAFLTGSPEVGGFIYGLYGLTRGLGVGFIIAGGRKVGLDVAQDRAIHLSRAAGTLSAWALVVIGGAAVALAGL